MFPDCSIVGIYFTKWIPPFLHGQWTGQCLHINPYTINTTLSAWKKLTYSPSERWVKILETFETYQYCDSKLRGLNRYRFPSLGPLKTEIFSQSSLLSFIFVFASSSEIQFKCRLWKFFFLIFCLLEMIFYKYVNYTLQYYIRIKGKQLISGLSTFTSLDYTNKSYQKFKGDQKEEINLNTLAVHK